MTKKSLIFTIALFTLILILTPITVSALLGDEALVGIWEAITIERYDNGETTLEELERGEMTIEFERFGVGYLFENGDREFFAWTTEDGYISFLFVTLQGIDLEVHAYSLYGSHFTLTIDDEFGLDIITFRRLYDETITLFITPKCINTPKMDMYFNI